MKRTVSPGLSAKVLTFAMLRRASDGEPPLLLSLPVLDETKNGCADSGAARGKRRQARRMIRRGFMS
jgi:hypothetical protein